MLKLKVENEIPYVVEQSVMFYRFVIYKVSRFFRNVLVFFWNFFLVPYFFFLKFFMQNCLEVIVCNVCTNVRGKRTKVFFNDGPSIAKLRNLVVTFNGYAPS